MAICLERGADLHTAQLMPLPLTVSCFSKIHIGFTFLVPAHPGSHRQSAIKQVCVCVCVLLYLEPTIFKVGRDVSHGSHVIVAPTLITEAQCRGIDLPPNLVSLISSIYCPHLLSILSRSLSFLPLTSSKIQKSRPVTTFIRLLTFHLDKTCSSPLKGWSLNI